MWRVISLLGVAIAACGPAAPAPISHHGPSTTAPPKLSLVESDNHVQKVAEQGLPAISANGQLVVYGMTELDPGQGLPTYRLEVRDRQDHVRETLQLLTYAESEEAFVRVSNATPPGTSADVSQAPSLAKLAEGNQWLAKLHAEHGLVAMAKLPWPSHDSKETEDERLRLSWAGIQDGVHELLIVDRSANRELSRHALPPWAAPAWCARVKYQDGPPDNCIPGCFIATAVVEAVAAVESKAVVVQVRYEAGNADPSRCFEGGEQLHVVTW